MIPPVKRRRIARPQASVNDLCLAAAAVIAAAATAAVVIAHAVPAATAAQQQNQDDDPPATAKTIVITHAPYLQKKYFARLTALLIYLILRQENGYDSASLFLCPNR